MAKVNKINERKENMIELRRAGWSFAAIAVNFGISQSRVRQILRDVNLKRVYVSVETNSEA